MAELTSAAVPPVGADDHVAGEGPVAIVYFDLACPACASAWTGLRKLALALCARHFPMASKRPRSPALHAAAEAAARQGAFWEMCDSLYADRGRADDPHLWRRAEDFGLDLERFEADRRSAAVEARIRRDFESGLRAGVTGTPTGFTASGMVAGELVEALERLAEGNPAGGGEVPPLRSPANENESSGNE